MIALLSLLFAAVASAAPLNVVTTTQDLAAIGQAVGGADVAVTAIARGDLDPHFIDAKPSYMVKLAQADLVVSVGMDLEVGWLPSLVTGSRNPKIQAGAAGNLDASTVIRRIGVPTGTIDRSRGNLHPAGNPHYWLDPENGRRIARALAQRFSQLDAAHAAAYAANLATFESQLSSKEKEWASRLAAVRGAALVSYHSTFDYLCEVYGFQVVGFIEPKPGIPPTPQHTIELIGKAKSAGAKWVFVEPYKNPSDAGPLSTSTGAKVVQLPTSVGAEPAIRTYFDLFDAIVKKLVG